MILIFLLFSLNSCIFENEMRFRGLQHAGKAAAYVTTDSKYTFLFIFVSILKGG